MWTVDHWLAKIYCIKTDICYFSHVTLICYVMRAIFRVNLQLVKCVFWLLSYGHRIYVDDSTVCACHIKIKGYLLTLLITSNLWKLIKRRNARWIVPRWRVALWIVVRWIVHRTLKKSYLHLWFELLRGQFWGFLAPQGATRCTDGEKIWHGGWDWEGSPDTCHIWTGGGDQRYKC